MDGWWHGFWHGVAREFTPASGEQAGELLVQLPVALLLGGLIGYEREEKGKPAGMRTHMLLSVGAALFVVASQHGGLQHADVSRVIQGIVTGIGFLGGGTILKMTDEGRVRGLTTAAGLWLATAVGVS